MENLFEKVKILIKQHNRTVMWFQSHSSTVTHFGLSVRCTMVGNNGITLRARFSCLSIRPWHLLLGSTLITTSTSHDFPIREFLAYTSHNNWSNIGKFYSNFNCNKMQKKYLENSIFSCSKVIQQLFSVKSTFWTVIIIVIAIKASCKPK